MGLGARQRRLGALLVALGASGCTGDPQGAAASAKAVDALNLSSKSPAGAPVVDAAAHPLQVSVAPSDVAAAQGATGKFVHASATATGRAKVRGFNVQQGRGRPQGQAGSSKPRYPGDLSYLGGQTLQQAVFHPVYVLLPGQTPDNVPIPGTWGDPEAFLRDLSRSEYVHIADQYTPSPGNNGYALGASVIVSLVGQWTTQLVDADAAAIAHAVAVFLGVSGQGHLFDLFLTPGTDMCLSPTICYSPDNPDTWNMCAYHGSAGFGDVGMVHYTVHPYSNVIGCSVAQPSLNGRLIDSVDQTLAHEILEAITDPEGDGWFNLSSGFWLGNEVGDECVFLGYGGDGVWAVTNPTSTIGSHAYAVQQIYSNADHACVTEPKGGNPK